MQVRLERCGSATLRLTDRAGRPQANVQVGLNVVVRDYFVHPSQLGLRNSGPQATDDQGRVTFEGLIPGATYWVWWGTSRKEFTAPAGKRLELTAVAGK